MNRISAFIGAIAFAAGSASAVVWQLDDRNSTILVDDASSAGMFNWTVDGVNHMYQQWFWYRVGNVAESPINSLPLTGAFASDTNPFSDPRQDTLGLRYENAQVRITPTWTLRGGLAGSNHSDVTEAIAIDNLTNAPLSISFFQYSDFDLGGTVQDQSVEIPAPLHNTAGQTDINGFTTSETVVTPQPSHYEVNFFPNTLNRLNDGLPDVLNDTAGPIGPGDLTWAFQWDLNIPAGGTVIISKDKSIVPAPGDAALLGIAGLALVRRRR